VAEEAGVGVEAERPPPVSAGPASSTSTVVGQATEPTTVEPTTVAPTTVVHVTTTSKPIVVTPTTTITVPLPEAKGAEVGDVEWLVRQTFPEDPDRAVRIAKRESGLQPGASNGQYAGIMQIGTTTHAALIASMGYSAADMYHAAPNLAVARRLFDAAGWSPWA